MTAYFINPIEDPRWAEFVDRHPSASVFHSPAWLEALRRTYGYEPVSLTTTAPRQDLTNGLVFCRVRSWLTGSRLVALPFSDHCEPLVNSHEEFEHLVRALKSEMSGTGADYLELRPITLPAQPALGLEPASRFCLHRLNLSPELEQIFRGFHKSSVQQLIQRATRENLACEQAPQTDLLRQFYHLLVLTRRRHGIPPPPFAWFRNLAACLAERLKIRVASKHGNPIASIVTVRHGHTLVYKYSCSDKRFSSLGGTQLLLWKAIGEAKTEGLTEFDLGRTDWDNEGLNRFKDRFGAVRETLTYWRYPGSATRAGSGWPALAASRILPRLPNVCLAAAGKLLYRHMG